MSLLPHHKTVPLGPDGLLDAIGELEQNTKSRIQTRRGNNRVELNCDVVVLPGNVSDRGTVKFEGSCRDISPPGCRLILNHPITVGDIYLVSFQTSPKALDPMFGRCVRCHMIREDAFEVGLSFFAPISLSEISPEEKQNTNLDLDLN